MRFAPLALVLLLAVFACDHPTPPEPGAYTPGGPFDTAVPRQLTFSPGPDLSPAWLPDGSGIVYQFATIGRPDGDRCLGILPAAGGSLRAEICNTRVKSEDSTDAYGSPAVSAGGRLLYTRASDFWRFHNAAPAYQSIVVAPLTTPLLVDSVQSLPYAVVPSGTMHYGIDQVRWLGDSAVIYVAERVIYGTCGRCQDTLRTGIELARMDLSASPGSVTPIPGTDTASSVALGAGDTIYYTVVGDTKIHRRLLNSGDTATVWAFDSIARDVQVRGAKLYAVVGGRVAYQHDVALGPLQFDSGGTIHAVNLATGTDSAMVNELMLFRHIALSPDGRRIVAEGYSLRTASPVPDLWLLDAP